MILLKEEYNRLQEQGIKELTNTEIIELSDKVIELLKEDNTINDKNTFEIYYDYRDIQGMPLDIAMVENEDEYLKKFNDYADSWEYSVVVGLDEKVYLNTESVVSDIDIFHENYIDIVDCTRDRINVDYKFEDILSNVNVDVRLEFINGKDGIEKLFQSQGYKLSDLHDKDKVEASPFLKSYKKNIDTMVENIDSQYDIEYDTDISEFEYRLNAVINTDIMTVFDLRDLFDNHYAIKKIMFDKKTYIGLYSEDEWQGSEFDIKLEKPFTVDIQDLNIIPLVKYNEDFNVYYGSNIGRGYEDFTREIDYK